MWYKLSQQWSNQNTAGQATPYGGETLSNNPSRQSWQDQNYVYFIDDSGATRSMQKTGPNGQENPMIQQSLGKNLGQIPQGSHNQNRGHTTRTNPNHHNYGPYNRSQVQFQQNQHQQQTPFQQNIQGAMQDLMANPYGVQQQGNNTVLSDPFGQVLQRFFPNGKLPQQPGLTNYIPKGGNSSLPLNLPTVTDTGRQTVRM